MKITAALKMYKSKKAEVETTLARINHLKYLLKTRNLEELQYYSKNHMKLCVQSGGVSSPVEKEVFRKITEHDLTRSLISEWIREDRIKIYPLQIEIEQITMALSALTKHEKFIIECRYFNKMQWMDTEMSFNEMFGLQRTDEGLGKKHDEALRKLHKILKPFYERFSQR